MNHEKAIRKQRTRRSYRVRKSTRGTSERPRLSVHRTLRHMYAQIIDDTTGKTLVAASSLDKDVQLTAGGNKDAAAEVGKKLAERASTVGVKTVCFDRGPFKFHGRVAALAEAARNGGLEF